MEASSEQPTSRPKATRTGKDSVFSDLFRIPHYQWKMVKALHPEWDLAEEEIRLLSLHSVLLNRPYNDLGLLVRNHLLILVEAQATWSVNVLVRILLYLVSHLVQKRKNNCSRCGQMQGRGRSHSGLWRLTMTQQMAAYRAIIADVNEAGH